MYIPRIILLEDNIGEKNFISEAARTKGYTIHLQNIMTWDECEAWSRELPYWNENEIPDLVIVGQSLSGYTAPQVVAFIRNISKLDNIPVVVYANYNNTRVVTECYRAGANSYIRKPANYKDSIPVIQHIIEYWFLTNVFPNKHTFRRALNMDNDN
jgi:CheY-like chemotaxis protein